MRLHLMSGCPMTGCKTMNKGNEENENEKKGTEVQICGDPMKLRVGQLTVQLQKAVRLA